MQILTTTTGEMDNFSRCLSINWTFSLICFLIWIFSTAEGYTTISQEVVGRKVKLPCNESFSTFLQLIWKMDGENLFAFRPQQPLYTNNKTVSLNLTMSTSESDQYALIMKQVQKSHAGNYTCVVISSNGPWERTWELRITDQDKNKLLVIVASAVPCVCFLVFVISLTFLKTVCKKRVEVQPPAVDMDTIYENCLEITNSQQSTTINYQHFHSKPRAQ